MKYEAIAKRRPKENMRRALMGYGARGEALVNLPL